MNFLKQLAGGHATVGKYKSKDRTDTKVLVSPFPIDVTALERGIHQHELFLQTLDPDPLILGPI